MTATKVLVVLCLGSALCWIAIAYAFADLVKPYISVQDTMMLCSSAILIAVVVSLAGIKKMA
jgi:hypothetical protein